MRPLLPFVCVALLSSCTSDDTPAWSLDPIYIEPAADGIIGFQTWEIFRDRWKKRQAPRHYLCAVVVALQGTETTCDTCAVAWEVQAEVLESDCGDAIAGDPTFVSVRAVGIGDLDRSDEAPYPGKTSVGWIDYGYDWEIHGWAYPDALDAGESASNAEWDADQPFTLWPRLAWPLPL